jgi:Bromodomain associated/Transcription factor TFIID complex subunit 8 C-term
MPFQKKKYKSLANFLSMGPEEAAEQILQICVSLIVRKAGYDSIESRALAHLASVSRKYIAYISTAVKKHAAYSHRAIPTAIDVIQAVHGMKIKLGAESVAEQPVLKAPIRTETERAVLPFKEMLPSEIALPAEMPPNYYNFLPPFPPAHTFKTTQIKKRILDDKAKKSRIRHEQATLVTESLFKMLESSGMRPKKANYLLQKH